MPLLETDIQCDDLVARTELQVQFSRLAIVLGPQPNGPSADVGKSKAPILIRYRRLAAEKNAGCGNSISIVITQDARQGCAA
jgi:hypothetical protein